MTRTDSELKFAVRGAFLGAAVGDALGWPQELRGGLVGGQRARDKAEPEPEFRLWTRHAGHYTRRYEDPVLPGEYSDDTQLLLAVARACMTGSRWLDHLTGVELPTWPLYQRGGGGAVLSASNSWADGRAPWFSGDTGRAVKARQRYVDAGANGAAMRIAPHAVVAANYDDLLDRVFSDGLTTHGHPRALVGATTYAVTIRAVFDTGQPLAFGDLVDAARGGLVPPERVMHLLPNEWGDGPGRTKFAQTWAATNDEMEDLLTKVGKSLQRGAMSNHLTTFEELGCANPKVNGAGTVTSAAAVYAASRFAARPMNGLLATAFLRKGDTDTLASMTGALLGALHGDSWLGDLGTTVQDAGYVARIGESLVSGRRPDYAILAGADARSLRKQWQTAIRRDGPPSDGRFPDGRRFVTADVERLGDVHRIRIMLEDGQSVIVDATAPPVAVRSRDDEPRRPTTRNDPSSDSAASDVSIDASGNVVSITAFTQDLNRVTSYYARLTGRDLDAGADETRITAWFVLRRFVGAADMSGGGVGVTVSVRDLDAAAKRVGEAAPGPGAQFFNTRDPDGRYVRVEQTRAAPKAPPR